MKTEDDVDSYAVQSFDDSFARPVIDKEVNNLQELFARTFENIHKFKNQVTSANIFNSSFIKLIDEIIRGLSAIKAAEDLVINQQKALVLNLKKKVSERSDYKHLVEEQQKKIQELTVDIERLNFQKGNSVEETIRIQELEEKFHAEYNRANRAEAKFLASRKNEQRLKTDMELLKCDKSPKVLAYNVELRTENEKLIASVEQKNNDLMKLTDDNRLLRKKISRIEAIQEKQCEKITELEERLAQRPSHIESQKAAYRLKKQKTYICKKCGLKNLYDFVKCTNCDFSRDESIYARLSAEQPELTRGDIPDGLNDGAYDVPDFSEEKYNMN